MARWTADSAFANERLMAELQDDSAEILANFVGTQSQQIQVPNWGRRL